MTRTQGNRRASLRVRVRGQSLVELALVAPLLVVMLLGAAQVGSLAFGLVSIDSAAREGARAGVLAPNCSLKTGMTSGCSSSGTQWYIPGNTSHQCTAADSTAGVTGNPVCVGAVSSSGTLNQSLFLTNPCADSSQACVTISVIAPNGLQSMEVNPPKVRLEVNSSCPQSSATMSGVVTGMPAQSTAIVSDSSGDQGPTDTSGNYSICAKVNGQGSSTQTLTAQVSPVGCGGYSGSIGPISVSAGTPYPNETIPVTAYPCPTATPTPTPTPTGTPGPTPIPGATPFPYVAPTPGCPAETASDTYYLQVTVTYPSPVFVPFIGAVFQTQPGSRLISTTVTEAIEPCTLTLGA
jgi:TadE-like protein